MKKSTERQQWGGQGLKSSGRARAGRSVLLRPRSEGRRPKGTHVEKLSLILWRERELLELLADKLQLERLVLARGQARWLNQANKEVEDVLITLRETEVLRAMAADEAAHEVGLEANPSLSA